MDRENFEVKYRLRAHLTRAGVASNVIARASYHGVNIKIARKEFKKQMDKAKECLLLLESNKGE